MRRNYTSKRREREREREREERREKREERREKREEREKRERREVIRPARIQTPSIDPTRARGSAACVRSPRNPATWRRTPNPSWQSARPGLCDEDEGKSRLSNSNVETQRERERENK